MNKTLIIAEKPTVALDISRALGGFTRIENYFENEKYVIVSSIGHLLGLIAPNDPVQGRWSFKNLPIIPKEFKLKLINKKSSERLTLLIKLIKRKDINLIINACDAGREGELIFRYIIQYSGIKKKIQRLWLQSMTKLSIIEAFKNLRDDISLKPLEDSARSRAEADWLVGINGTRAMTALNSKEGGFFKTTVGRVQTPTLAIVTSREEKIRSHIPKKYWEIHATFHILNGSYQGCWIELGSKKNELKEPDDKECRIWSLSNAKKILLDCQNQSGVITEKFRTSLQAPPNLFDLTSLQRESNIRFGFTASNTLNIVQKLYERHKVLTYPRTDSRYLPEDYVLVASNTVNSIFKEFHNIPSNLIKYAKIIIENDWIQSTKRIFDNKKVSDHFAIIPTQQAPKNLNEIEWKLYDIVLKRFLAVFFPSAKSKVITRLTKVKTHYFKSERKILIQPGWLEIYGKESVVETNKFPLALEKEQASIENITIQNFNTKPLPRYHESTLLTAMEGAGKFIEDEKLREAISIRGLGTSTTRSSIIDGLINENYLRRDDRDLIPTAKANQLIALLSGLKITELTSPELTGEWEQKLKKIEQGKLDRDNFMKEIIQMTKVMVDRSKKYNLDTIPGNYAILKTVCPKCNGVVREKYNRYGCIGCDFSISKHPGKRILELFEAEELLSKKKIGPIKGFFSKKGYPFSAILLINEKHKLEFDFGDKIEINEKNKTIDFSNEIPVGKCLKCSSNVFEHGMYYLCEKSIGPSKVCDFYFRKIILQQEISNEQISNFLSNGRTELLNNFISTRTKRKFKAVLVYSSNSKTGFKFEYPSKENLFKKNK